MILRFASGSVTPASRSRNSVARVDEHQRQLQPLEAPSGSAPPRPGASRRCRRRCRSADRRSRGGSSIAATVESTPPLRPHTTRPSPTCSPDPRRSPRRRTTPSSSRRCSRRRRTRSGAGCRAPCRCARLPGGTATRRAGAPRRHRRDRRVGARRGDRESGRRGLHEVAVARPHAQLDGDRRRTAARRGAMLIVAQAELAMRRRRDLPAERVRHQLHAVADARAPARRRRTPPASQCGAPASDTLFGPPDRMTPAGCAREHLGQRRVERQNLGVDRQLAQPASDQLRELRAEIEDDDGLMGHGESAIIRCASRGHHHIL